MKRRRNHRRSFFSVLTAIVAAVAIPVSAGGKIYKYKDADGNWRYTDSPVATEENMDVLSGIQETGPKARNLKEEFAARYDPKNAVERATLMTVKVETPIGSGSGFFVNADGYILTNKHVIKGDEAQKQQTARMFKEIDGRIKAAEKQFEAERRYLEETRRRLDEYKRRMDRQEDLATKMAAEGQYNQELRRYEARKEYYDQKKAEFDADKRKYSSQKYDYRSKSRQAHTRTFTITLKDRSKMEAHLVALSADHDLALLKLDRCLESPYLSPRGKARLSQGQKVYAVGSPLGIRDNVSSGVVSGFDSYYIRTNAHIYPGNSGGPLIDADGNVVGINTLKMITRKFEGIGFAIDIKEAMKEFRSYLGGR